MTVAKNSYNVPTYRLIWIRTAFILELIKYQCVISPKRHLVHVSRGFFAFLAICAFASGSNPTTTSSFSFIFESCEDGAFDYCTCIFTNIHTLSITAIYFRVFVRIISRQSEPTIYATTSYSFALCFLFLLTYFINVQFTLKDQHESLDQNRTE